MGPDALRRTIPGAGLCRGAWLNAAPGVFLRPGLRRVTSHRVTPRGDLRRAVSTEVLAPRGRARATLAGAVASLTAMDACPVLLGHAVRVGEGAR